MGTEMGINQQGPLLPDSSQADSDRPPRPLSCQMLQGQLRGRQAHRTGAPPALSPLPGAGHLGRASAEAPLRSLPMALCNLHSTVAQHRGGGSEQALPTQLLGPLCTPAPTNSQQEVSHLLGCSPISKTAPSGGSF